MLFAASGGYDSVALAPLYEGPPQRYDFGAGLVFVDRCGEGSRLICTLFGQLKIYMLFEIRF